MKKALTSLFFVLVIFSSCKKDNPACTRATIIQEKEGCMRWFIKTSTSSYPAGNIPEAFKVNNLVVCVTYKVYDDPRECICCGGQWADVKTIK
ncbi:MAG: hypothetical protein ABIT07_00040 [Ferruginibacter sp.]